MSLLPLFQWIEHTDFSTALRESALVYPTVMATHLTGMALFGGMIFITDLRILGIAMRGMPVRTARSRARGAPSARPGRRGSGSGRWPGGAWRGASRP